MAQKTTPKKSVGDDPRFAQAVQNYEAGLHAMQERKFDKAKTHLLKVVSGPSKELADRAGVYLTIATSSWTGPRTISRVRKNTMTTRFL